MKVLGCKIEDSLYDAFKAKFPDVSSALRQLIVDSLETPSEDACIPPVNRLYTADAGADLDVIHDAVDTLPARSGRGIFK